MAEINFGRQTVGATNIWQPQANQKSVCRFQNTTGQILNIDKACFKWGINQGPTKVKAVIYSDNAGAPDALLAVSPERNNILSAWETFTFASPPAIAIDAYVWAGHIADANMLAGTGITTASRAYNNNTYTSGPTSTFGSYSTEAKAHAAIMIGDDGQSRFGRSSVDAIAGNYQPNREHGERFVFGGAVSVLADSVSTYIQTTSATVKSKAAIFSDVAGVPGVPLAQTNEVVGSTADTWLVLPLTTPYTLVPGTAYWLCFVTDTNLVTPVIPAGGWLWVDGNETEALAWQNPPPALFLYMSGVPSGIDIYASYSAIPPAASGQGNFLQFF